MNEYVKLAKNAIETYIKIGEKVGIPENLPEEFYNCRKGVFVTIYAKSESGVKKNCADVLERSHQLKKILR